MTLDEAIEHGRAWVAAGWTWAQGQAVLFITDDGVTEGWIWPHDTHRLRIDGPVCVGVEIVPDMRDRGTLGHALGQVCDAWDDHDLSPGRVDANAPKHRGYWFVTSWQQLYRPVAGYALTKAEALLAARRAAP